MSGGGQLSNVRSKGARNGEGLSEGDPSRQEDPG